MFANQDDKFDSTEVRLPNELPEELELCIFEFLSIRDRVRFNGLSDLIIELALSFADRCSWNCVQQDGFKLINLLPLSFGSNL